MNLEQRYLEIKKKAKKLIQISKNVSEAKKKKW